MNDAALAGVEGASHLERYFASSPIAFAVIEGPLHALTYANPPFERLIASATIGISTPSTPTSSETIDLTPLLDRVFAGTSIVRDEVLAERNGGTPRWSCTAWLVSSRDESGISVMVEVRDVAQTEGALEQQRALAGRLLVGALRDRDAARDAAEQGRLATFLASAGRELALSLDESTTRALMQRATLPRADTWCIVDLMEQNGAMHRLAVLHPDLTKQDLAKKLAETWQPHADDAIGIARFAGAERGLVPVTEASADALLAAAHGPENLAILRELGFGSLLVVPLVSRGTVLGAITFVSREGDAPFTEAEIALATDIGDRCAMALENARLYREMDVLRAAADVANSAKSTFLGSMSHELRTPLNAIGGYAEILQLGLRGPVTEAQRVDLGRIKLNQENLLKLITEILNFVSEEGIATHLPMTAVSIVSSVGDVAELVEGTIRDRGLRLVVVPCDTSAQVVADEDRLRRILTNLLTNAAKYTPANGGDVVIECMVQRDVVEIIVSDNGPGIPADQLETIFEPFVQLMSGFANRQGGVGLGLAISRDLARAMRGDLTVASTLGEGSRFTLTLPRARQDSPAESERPGPSLSLGATT